MYNGVINVYKEKGFTSHDVVAKMRGILKQKKIGHTGTLDPDAEGVLPVCLGHGTKLSDLLTDQTKSYRTTLLLGRETDTQDISGQVLKEESITADENRIVEVINGFIGDYHQIPPMYSALKVNGKKLYQLAREGKVIERSPRLVEILEIKILSLELPRVVMDITCSKGTYIRTLCHDIGKALGSCGCMESLIRIRVERFEISSSLKLDEIEALQREDQLKQHIIPVDQIFSEYPAVYTKNDFDYLAHNGNHLMMEHIEDTADPAKQPVIRIYDSKNQFIGLYEYHQEKLCFKPRKMFLGG